MKAIARRGIRYLDERARNSGPVPFFRYFQILRAHCDLIRLPRYGRDGWSVRISPEFLTKAHTPLREVTVRESHKGKRRAPPRNLFETDAELVTRDLYLLTRGTRQVISYLSYHDIYFSKPISIKTLIFA